MKMFCHYISRTLLPVVTVLIFCSCAAPGVQTVVPVPENAVAPASPPGYWPRINEFTVSADNITPGENITLKWDVADANIIAIDQGVGKVPVMGTMQVAPQKSTKFTLTATGEKGISTAWIMVKVADKITLMPDLVITSITHISGLLYYTIKNVGGADAGLSDTYLWDQSNMWRDTSWVNGLKAGEEKTQPFTNFSYNGTKITVCADGGNVIREANEDNNCFVPTFGYKFNYDFQQYASRATWRGSAGRPEYGLASTSTTGRANKLNSVVAGDGKNYTNAIEMVPAPDSYAWIEGLFGDWQDQWQAGGYMLPLELPNNARFTAKVGLSREVEGGGTTTFLFGVMEASGAINWWPGVEASNDGTLQSMDIDLSSYANKKVMAILRVESGADINKNYALWIGPRISQ